MKTNIGEEGTEQFSVKTRVNGKLIGDQKIHDPFIHTTVKLRGLGHAWRALFGGITVHVAVQGSHGAERAIMTLDPLALQSDTEQWVADLANRRNNADVNSTVAYHLN